jgi:hypothetical protein
LKIRRGRADDDRSETVAEEQEEEEDDCLALKVVLKGRETNQISAEAKRVGKARHEISLLKVCN